MSRAAKLTLGAAFCGSALIVWGVHFLQQQERNTMYQGVLRDDERRREKMRQREEDYQRSMQKRELYERVQTVSKPVLEPDSHT
ncbi:uncharacterized protein TRAVEDRAFT_147933 [Trametes versicolor FP-101664 SS1]|uniref:uncharacterized protein n=1 Tax=Trametes versicolor (strain FP-101664) TaxID=717944 RepID=UPI00046237C0|nr:uncharacterized protein TRAVEDRAFT_147933 [Trametes versicolor FP-101664 SS1]EIW59794.1 hypothetical protein TRAVEDRAFT_147933 [Trametes versicolor FP-101664 SS1]